MNLQPPIPILRIFDETKAKEFYVDYLVHCVISSLMFWEGYFGERQGAKKEHSRSYETDEQRSLSAKDTAKAQNYLLHSVLGFNIDWEYRFEENRPLFLQASKGNCVIHLSEHHGDGTPGTRVRIECDKLQAYQDILKSKHYKYLNPGIVKQPWGPLEMHLTDPFGNGLIFFEPE